MSNTMTVECLVCRKHRGEIAVPGGIIFENDLISISHAQLFGEEKDHYLGHVYSFFIGDGVPHVHVHVIGRRPGAPREYWGPKVDDWPDAPRGGEAEIGQVAARLREYLSEHYG